MEQHAGRGIAARRGAAQIAAAGRSKGRSDADAARSEVVRAGGELRGQWLQFKNIDVVRPDLEKFPMFDDGLRQAMRRETEMFIENIIRNDRSVLELLDTNYTFVNERLARFYGIPGVTGPEFRRVNVSATERGGGILAHASVLTVSSYSTRTSPVLRGKWILENLLNAPPPAPPPGVPPLDESKGAAPQRCASRWRRIGRVRPAPPAIRAWTRSASAWRISTRSARGAPRTATSRWMRPALCPTDAPSRRPLN